jgi:hypothetical protein
MIATGADTEFFRPATQNEIANSMTFVGSMDWLPNEDAMFFFIDEILPLIRREAPDATLSIIGPEFDGRFLPFD